MLKKLIFAIILCIVTSCGVGYEYTDVIFKPTKAEKIERIDTTFYKVKLVSKELNKVETFRMDEIQYKELTNYGKVDIMSINFVFPYKIKIEYD